MAGENVVDHVFCRIAVLVVRQKTSDIGDGVARGQEWLLEGLSILVLQGRQDGEGLIERCLMPFVWCNPKSPLQYSSEETKGIIGVARSPATSRWVMISPSVSP